MGKFKQIEPYRRVLTENYLADYSQFPGLHALQVANARRQRDATNSATSR